MDRLPEWMTTNEQYEPVAGGNRFVTKSILTMLKLLNRFRESGQAGRTAISVPLKLVGTIYVIVLSACARNMFFVYVLLALVMVYMCQMPGKALVRVFGSTLTACLFTAILLLPSAFLGTPQTMLTITVKVFFSVSLMGILSETTPWNQLTSACARFHIPNLFIFTLDTTIKYIAILGEISTHLLQALKLRSVGKNKRKEKSMAGVLGVTFLKSKEMSEEMYQAMICRGFEGEYRRVRKKYRLNVWDIVCVMVLVGLTALYIYLR